MAGWNNTAEIRVGETGEVYTAPSGSTLPTTTTGAPAAAFVGLGFHTEDGVSIQATPNIAEFNAWQVRTPVRREALATEILTTFDLQQWDENTVPLAFGGGAITGTTPNYRYDFPTDTAALNEVASVVDVVDGSTTLRFVWPRANVTEPVTTKFARSETAKLPIGLKVLSPAGGGSPGYFLTNDAGFLAGS